VTFARIGLYLTAMRLGHGDRVGSELLASASLVSSIMFGHCKNIIKFDV